MGCEAGCPAGGPPRVVCGLVRTLSIDSCTDPRRGKRCRGESGLVTYRVAALGGTHAPPAPGHVNGAAQSLCAGWVHQEVYGGHAGDLRFRFTFSSCRTCFLGLPLIAVCFNKVFFAVMKSLPFVN